MKQHLQKSERVKTGGVYATKRPKRISEEKKRRWRVQASAKRVTTG